MMALVLQGSGAFVESHPDQWDYTITPEPVLQPVALQAEAGRPVYGIIRFLPL